MITELNHFIMNRLFYKSIESAGNGIFSRSDCLINLIDFFGVFDYRKLQEQVSQSLRTIPEQAVIK